MYALSIALAQILEPTRTIMAMGDLMPLGCVGCHFWQAENATVPWAFSYFEEIKASGRIPEDLLKGDFRYGEESKTRLLTI
jgi:hypothetical protein